MILGDSQIFDYIEKGDIRIGNRSYMEVTKAIQPNSLDLHLGNTIRVFNNYSDGFVYDPRDKTHSEHYELQTLGDGFVLEPNQFILASTLEDVSISRRLTACVEGISSVGRFGLFVVNAGRVESGWSGELTLELLNSANHSTLILPGMRIAQLVFSLVMGPVTSPYEETGRYQGSTGAVSSKSWRDYL